MRRALVIALLTASFGGEEAWAEASVPQSKSLVLAGFKRSYTLYVPSSYSGKVPAPLVLVLHGSGGNGLRILTHGRWISKAEHEGFIVVGPDAYGRNPHWNAGFDGGKDLPVDDVMFLSAVIKQVEGDFRVDPKRIYICGISSGALMSYKLGAELSEVIAAIGPVAGSIGAQVMGRDRETIQIPKPERSVSVIAFHGTADPDVPYDGSQTGKVRFVAVAKSVEFWVKHDGCDPIPHLAETRDHRVVRSQYACGVGADVVLYTIKGGGHLWPGGGSRNDPSGLNATDIIWEFFETHPKADAARRLRR